MAKTTRNHPGSVKAKVAGQSQQPDCRGSTEAFGVLYDVKREVQGLDA